MPGATASWLTSPIDLPAAGDTPHRLDLAIAHRGNRIGLSRFGDPDRSVHANCHATGIEFLALRNSEFAAPPEWEILVSFPAMYRIDGFKKRDPLLRWNLPDRVFFACGACHILVLAYAFLERYKLSSAEALWIKPEPGFTGNHIFVADGEWAFDYHGYSKRHDLLEHTRRKAQQWWPGWNASVVQLPPDVLISEVRSRSYEGLWLREPTQFLHDALPRARAYLARFPAPE